MDIRLYEIHRVRTFHRYKRHLSTLTDNKKLFIDMLTHPCFNKYRQITTLNRLYNYQLFSSVSSVNFQSNPTMEKLMETVLSQKENSELWDNDYHNLANLASLNEYMYETAIDGSTQETPFNHFLILDSSVTSIDFYNKTTNGSLEQSKQCEELISL